LRLGKRITYLRDVEGLKWREIVERLDISTDAQAIGYYKTYGAMFLAGKATSDTIKKGRHE